MKRVGFKLTELLFSITIFLMAVLISLHLVLQNYPKGSNAVEKSVAQKSKKQKRKYK